LKAYTIAAFYRILASCPKIPRLLGETGKKTVNKKCYYFAIIFHLFSLTHCLNGHVVRFAEVKSKPLHARENLLVISV
jgi:hypothetical protein